jgi:ankyrin repeat protein
MQKEGVTPLMRAATRSDVAKMKLLIKEGTKVSDADSSGWTALMYAAAAESSEPVRVLLASQ